MAWHWDALRQSGPRHVWFAGMATEVPATLQVRGGLSALPLSSLCDSDIDALKPLLGVLLVFGLENIGLAVGEDLKGPGQAAVPALLCHHFNALHLVELNGAVVGVVFLKHREDKENQVHPVELPPS